MAGIFKAYDVRGLYPEAVNGAIAERIGRAYAAVTGVKSVVNYIDLINTLIISVGLQNQPRKLAMGARVSARAYIQYEPDSIFCPDSPAG